MSETIYDIPVNKIDGKAATLSEHKGEVLLVVNVASKCGLTPQYEGLEKLHEKYSAKKFAVLGFPANDFGAQEPGSDSEIQNFCKTTYDVQFPLYSKIPVTGSNKHPLYKYLTTAKPDTEDREGMEAMLRGYKMEPTAKPEVVWNFEKFLINRQGQVVRRFAPDTAPDAPKLLEAIEAELEAVFDESAMIVLSLQCIEAHHFEGWFVSVEDFDRQAQADMVACPMCGSKDVSRLPSGPRVRRASDAAPTELGSQVSGQQIAAQGMAHMMRVMAEMAKNSEDVAGRFPEEARRMHYGEVESRNIRGQATLAETRELLEEGIAVMPLPFPAKEDVH